jgi:hypothetical protein
MCQKPKLGSGGLAEFLQGIDATAVPDQFVQFKDVVVRRPVGLDRDLHDALGAFDRLTRRQCPHRADHRVQRDQIGDLRFAAHDGPAIGLRCRDDELPVEFFPAPNVVRAHAGSGLLTLVEPAGEPGRQPTDHRPGKRGQG